MGRGLLGYPIRPADVGKAQITHVSSQERCSTYLESIFREAGRTADRGYHCQCGEARHGRFVISVSSMLIGNSEGVAIVPKGDGWA